MSNSLKEAGDDLNLELKVVRVLLLKEKKAVGDKMAGRHGNKGVISVCSRSRHAFPSRWHTIADSIKSSGVPSRMNIDRFLKFI
jgi:DNA-directed RNA polymerase subunit beta